MSDTNVSINIRPSVALIDEVVQIEVSGLSPFHHATLVCRVSEKNGKFFSSAIYRSDITGKIDVSTMAAIDGGTYTGIEPMGLIWSMIQEPGQKRGRRLLKSDVTTPLITHLYLLRGIIPSHQCLTEIENKNYLLHTTYDRIYMAEGVERIEVSHGRLIGTMFIPAGQGPFPGVLDLFGMIGGVVEDRAALLASRGVATLALGYFHIIKKGDQTVDLEYFEEGLDYLLSHQKVIKPLGGIIGTSFGGLYAAELGAVCPKIKVCLLVNSHGFAGGNHTTYRGQRMPLNEFDFDLVQYSDEGLIFKYFYTKEHLEKLNPIPIEKGSCTYVLIHGEDDQCVDPVVASYMYSRLKSYGKSNYRVYVYPGAGHLIHPPYNPHYYATFQPSFHSNMVWGGRKQEHYKAEVEAWETLLYFIKTELVPQETNAFVRESRL